MMRAIDAAVVSTFGSILGTNSTLFWFSHTYFEDAADPRTKGFFFVDVSNVTISLFMALYAFAVWVVIPFYMRNRPAYNLKRAIIFYDFFMVFLNAYFFYKSLELSDWGRELFKFEDTRGDTSPRAQAYISIANLYFISKLVDMFDTFFMAFKKKFSQISFLHVWHHTSLSYAGWLYMKYNPYTPSILLIPFINTFIHMIMYGYYGLAALGPHMQRYLWWKKYITQIQLLQFTCVFAWYTMLTIKWLTGTSDLPIGYLMCNLGNSAFLFGLFSHFYIQSYQKERAAAASSKKKLQKAE